MKFWLLLFLSISFSANADCLDQLKQQDDLTSQVYYRLLSNKKVIRAQLKSADLQQNAQAVIAVISA